MSRELLGDLVGFSFFFAAMLWSTRQIEHMAWQKAYATSLTRAVLWIIFYKAVMVLWP